MKRRWAPRLGVRWFARRGAQRWWPLASCAVAALFVILLVASDPAWARPGGGQSYSGGGGHSSSGGGGGSSDGAGAEIAARLFIELLRLVFYYPKLMLPLVAIVGGYFLWSAYQTNKNKDWNSGPPTELHRAIDLNALRNIDPDFSQVGFEDFAFRLFATAHRNRANAPQRATLAPYVSLAARQQLGERESGPVQSVVVGAMRVVGISLPAPTDEGAPATRIAIEFEANVTSGPASAMQTAFSVETWHFSRAATARSKPPKLGQQTEVLPCPNCGAPWAATATGTQTCAACGEVVDNGRFDWVVDTIFVNSIQARPPTLTANVQERGTDLLTYRQPEFPTVLRQLSQEDPTVNISEIQARLTMIYDRLNKAWSADDLTPVRGLLSMSQYDSLQYWLDAYGKQDLRNQLLDMHITNLESCKLLRDRYFDALTIRIWATGKDFVVNRSSSRVVTGSKTKDRAYSEYWTLIRAHGAKGPAKADATCGHCGAELKINAAGACEYCGSALTSGDFDWVLSKIEQDDSYRG